MANTADLIIRITTQVADKGLDQTAGKVGKVRGALGKMALPAGVALGAVVAFGKGAVEAASRTQQAIGAVDSVFGKNAGTVKKWASSAATDVGLAKSEYLEMASVLGAQLKNMGIPLDQVAGKTQALITKGADLAATFGGTSAQAVEALGSALRGETDPIEKYGISIKQADIAAQQAKDGTDKLTGAAGKQAKTMALLKLVNEQSADATGQFARESDSAAGSAQIAAAQYEDMQATLGTALLPVVSAVTGALGKLASQMAKHQTTTKVVIAIIAALAVGILALNVALGIYTAVTTLAASTTLVAWAAALWPILAVVAGVALVALGFKLLWERSKTFRTIVLGTWGAIKSAFRAMTTFIRKNWKTMLIALTGPIGIAVALIIKNWGKIRTVVSAVTAAIKTLWRNAIDAVKTKLSAFRASAVTIWNAIKTAVGNVVEKVRDLVQKVRDIKVPGAVVTALDNIKAAADKVVTAIKEIIDWIKNIPIPKINWPSPPGWLSKVTGRSAVAPAPEAGARTAMAAARAPRVGLVGARAGSISPVVQINIQGALDPDAVARQIGRILAGHDRRVGSTGLRRGSVVVN